jgi:hypothetical protein
MRGKLARGSVRAMGGRRWLPTAACSSVEWRSGAAVVIGLRCARQGEKRCKWFKYELLVLLSRRGREIESVRVCNMAAARWRPAEARVVVARAKEDSEEGK